LTLLRGGPGGICGKSGIETTDDKVDGRDALDGVSGTARNSWPVGSPPDWGLYWKTGVWSCTLEASRIEGTLLGRWGRRGGGFPGGGRNDSPSSCAGAMIGPGNGHCGAGAGFEMDTPICPSLVCNGKEGCGRGGRGARGNPEFDAAGGWRGAEGRAICGSSGGMASLGRPAAARSRALLMDASPGRSIPLPS
jgi:hypothetical protein